MHTRSFNNRGPKKYLFQSHYKNAGSLRLGRRRLGGRPGERIDPAKFINKAIMAEGDEYFMPEHKFQDFKIDQRLIRAIANKGYKIPTPIQDQIISHIIERFDVVGIADTGTGKTAAFLLPLINKILQNSRQQILIVAPTRELAIQIDQEFKFFARGMRIFSVCCVGGASIGRQISELRYNYNLIIGTPGRLKDLIRRRMINLSKFNTVVLDEADRMLDMGFINDTRFIMNGMPKERQTLFFAATLSNEIERIIKEFTKNPVRISVKTRDTSKNVEQDIIKIEQGKTKLDILNNLLNKKEFNKVLIFGRTKHGVEKLSKTLLRNGFSVESIHGNKNNSQRQRALGMFKDNRVQILVATDVAARGLDIADVSHVINYDIPATYDDYIHRIGRTGRWNKRGIALTFIE
ncbi:MAG: RNA helicase [Candidatus Nealsonbacteria bacterium CG23_combo_of_CG06-09_8_20_14_all_37_18]|uniref:RNA helicase n=2 Tax=Candidatus Nealsoniibacteriota TaxID=1817911 RepID=A0A2G9Z0F5_9BACT|nr:MAG: RNA helicase [Candidatus Nealsonbacteria bacterium CG23_combo_of_CG06-09_8_20_14_all_37_18]